MRAASSAVPATPSDVDLDLGEATRAAEDEPQPPDRVAAHDLVLPVGRDHEDGRRLEVDGEPRQQVHGRAVGPLQIVEEDGAATVLAEAGEPGRQGVDQGRRRRRRRLRGLLGDDQRQIGRQRPHGGERPRLYPQVRPDQRRDRGVRLRRLLRRLRDERGDAASPECSAYQLRLPGACLARDEHEAAASLARPRKPRAEVRELPLALDEPGLGLHWLESRPPPGAATTGATLCFAPTPPSGPGASPAHFFLLSRRPAGRSSRSPSRRPACRSGRRARLRGGSGFPTRRGHRRPPASRPRRA